MKTFLYSLSLRFKLGLLTFISVAGLLAMTVVLVYGQYQQSLNERKSLVQSAVQTASGVLAWAQEEVTQGRLTPEQAQEKAYAAISLMRFGHNNNEYFWIIDSQGTILMHPIDATLKGKGSDTIRDPNGVYITKEAAQTAAQSSGKGFFSYQWRRPNEQEPVDKISYAQAFAPWNAVVVSGLYIDDLKMDLMSALVRVGIMAAVMLVVIGMLSHIISNSMLRGLSKVMRVLARIAEGNLTSNATIKGKDEIGQLLGSVMQMQQEFARVVVTVRRGAEGVSTASAEIAHGNHDLSGRTEGQASALQETAASMEQLNSTVKQNADNARQANQLAQSASTVATEGGVVVADVVRTMREINESSSRIGDIISVIDSIAFQTNILALNAAVEAARAGEQGRGFAVVASEVRSLAGRSADAARQIKALIDVSVQRVESGTALVDKAGQTMTEVVSSIRRVTDIVGEISAASIEQSQGVSQVGEAVSQMDQTTQQNAALVEEMAAAASSLSQQAQSLLEAVSVFKLGTSSASNTPKTPNFPSASNAPNAPYRPAAARPAQKSAPKTVPKLASKPVVAQSPAKSVTKPVSAPSAHSTPKLISSSGSSGGGSSSHDDWESF